MNNTKDDIREMLRNWAITHLRVKTNNPEFEPEEVYEIVSRIFDISLGIKGATK
jgi:hypothetical protein